MSKLIGLAFAAMLLLLSAHPGREQFAKYKAVEAYEVRPGILMMPRYSADGQVCEIGLERRQYSPEMIRLDSDLSREEIDQIFEELVPARGPRSNDFAGNTISENGPGMVTNMDFENASIQIFSKKLPGSSRKTIVVDDVAATILLKNRKCQ
jgi:hypothetical protein